MPSIVPEADESDESESSPGDEGDPSDSDGEVDFDYTERELDGRSLSPYSLAFGFFCGFCLFIVVLRRRFGYFGYFGSFLKLRGFEDLLDRYCP